MPNTAQIVIVVDSKGAGDAVSKIGADYAAMAERIKSSTTTGSAATEKMNPAFNPLTKEATATADGLGAFEKTVARIEPALAAVSAGGAQFGRLLGTLTSPIALVSE